VFSLSSGVVVKVIELVGCSAKDWTDAAQNALVEASKTVKNIVGIDVKGCSGVVKNGKIVEYRANVKLAFIVEKERL